MLHYDVKALGETQRQDAGQVLYDYSTDTRANLKGADFRRDRYLFLTPGYLCLSTGSGSYEILLGPAFAGRLYVKGMHVDRIDTEHGPKTSANNIAKLWGYNLCRFSMKKWETFIFPGR